MRTGTKMIITAVGLIILGAVPSRQANDINKASWLIGTWENKTSRGIIFEAWKKVSDLEMSGMSYVINGNDTIVFESIRLVQEQDGLYYIPVVKNQNDGLPVRFAMKSISETQMVFENPQHDFPQVISYKKVSADSLVAEISGLRDGQERKQAFPMRRVQ